MINVYLLLDYGVHGCYAFSMGFFISYLRHICDTSYLAIRYNLD